MEFSEIKKIISDTCANAGIAEFEIYYTNVEEMSTETLKDEISAFTSGLTSGIGFRCIVDGHMGYASTSLFEENEIESLVYRAIDNAKVIENDDMVFIYKGSEKYEKTTAPLPKDVSAADLKRAAIEIQKKNYEASEYVTEGTQSYAMSYTSETYLFNSNGLDLYDKCGNSACGAAPVVNKDGESQGSFEISDGLDESLYEELAKKATQNALDRIGAEEIPTGKYNVVIDGKQMRQILGTFSSVFSAKGARLGMSKLAGKEGEKIAADCVNVIDDPMREGCAIQASFDGEGVATYRKEVISNGVLNTLLYNLTEAQLAGKKSTGNGLRGGYAGQVTISPFNFGLCPGKYSQEELFELAGDGVYVTGMKGFHAGADAVTGDFSIESEGFLIEHGKRGKAIKSFTIAGNFFDLLKDIEALGNETKWGYSSLCMYGSPDVLLKNVSVAGK